MLTKLWNSPTATSWIYFLVVPLRLFILTPLVLSHFSKQELDVFFLLSSSTVLATVIEFRLCDTFDKLLSFAIVNKKNSSVSDYADRSHSCADRKLFERTRQTQRSLTCILIIPVGVLCGLLGWLSLGRLLNWDFAKIELWAALTVTIFTSLFSIFISPLQSNLKALDRVALANRVGLIITVSTIVTSAIAVMCGAKLLVVCLIQFAFIIISYFVYKQNQPALIKEQPLTSWFPDHEVMRESRLPLLRGMLMQLATFGTMRSAGMIMAGSLATGQLAQFLFAQNLLVTLSNFGASPLISQLPRYARELARDQNKEVVRDGIIRIGLSFSIMMLGVLFAPVAAKFIFPWIKSQVDFLDAATWFVLGFTFVLYTAQNLLCILYDSNNKQVFYLKFLFASLVAVTSLLFVNYFFANSPMWVFCLLLTLPYLCLINTCPIRKLASLGDVSSEKCYAWLLAGGWLYIHGILRNNTKVKIDEQH